VCGTITKEMASSSSESKIHKRFHSWLKASATLEQGNVRETMEDRICISHFAFGPKTFYIFLLLDGHGGAEVADYVQEHFVDSLRNIVIRQNGHRIRECIRESFVHMDKRVRKMKSGSTASLILVVHSPPKKVDVWMANVGDSTIYGVNGDKVRKLSVDHKVTHGQEQKRILDTNSYTIEDGYVCTDSGSMLAVTRALGDREFGDGILPEPTIKRLTTKPDIIIIASDGIWDVMNGKEVWARLNSKKEKKAWRDSAYRINKWRNEQHEQHDNTSLILLYIDWSQLTVDVSVPSTHANTLDIHKSSS